MESWMTSYKKASYVDLETVDQKAFVDYTKKCAEEMSWEYEVLKGDPALIRNLFSADWNEDDFLILDPGQEAKPSYDENIIKACHAARC